ncbi:hypothetical protein [Capnocytophaga canimorsus]|uniref:hypothetical protein n=1 Tax=Capnocytophaga canimorsus TaxID=28188 RepID=UPI0037CFE9DF
MFPTFFVPVSFSCWLRGVILAERRSRHNPLRGLGSPAHRQHPIQSLQQYPPRFQQDLVQDLILVVTFLPV